MSGWGRVGLAAILAGLAMGWIKHPVAQPGFCLAVTALGVAWLGARLRQQRTLVVIPTWVALAGVPVWIAGQRVLLGTIAPREAAGEFALWAAAALAGLLLLNEIQDAGEMSQAVEVWVVAGGVIAAWALARGVGIAEVPGPFRYHNKLAQFAELIVPMAIWLAAVDAGRRWRWVCVAALLLAATVVAASRAGVVLLGVEAFLCVLLLAGRRLMSRRQAGLLLAQLALAAGVAVAIAGWEELAPRLEIRRLVEDRRFDLNRSSLAMARAHLPWGVGYGAWPAVYPGFALFDDGRYANQAHNDWLQWLCEGGWPGVGLMVLFVGLTARSLLRSVWGCGVLVVFVHAAVDYPFHQSAPLAVLVMAVALMACREGSGF